MLTRRAFIKGVIGSAAGIWAAGYAGLDRFLLSAGKGPDRGEASEAVDPIAGMSKIMQGGGEAYLEWGPSLDYTVSGYPRQPRVHFPSGGSIVYNMDGGTKKPVSLAFEEPFGVMHAYISLGELGGYSLDGNGQPKNMIIEVPPNSPGYYRVFIEKTMTYKPYITYFRYSSLEPWTPAARGFIQSEKVVPRLVKN